MDNKRLRQLAGIPLMEAAPKPGETYESSEYFENDVGTVYKALDQLTTIMASSDWQEWMKASDYNFGGNYKFSQRAIALRDAIAKADKDFNALYGDLVKVSEE